MNNSQAEGERQEEVPGYYAAVNYSDFQVALENRNLATPHQREIEAFQDLQSRVKSIHFKIAFSTRRVFHPFLLLTPHYATHAS
jgi:hypothetical protein